MLTGFEYEKFIYKLNAAKEAYKTSRRYINFKGFLRSYKFSEEGSPYYDFQDDYLPLAHWYLDTGLLEEHREDSRVAEILKEAQEFEDFRNSAEFKLSPSQLKAKEFLMAVEDKKGKLKLPDSLVGRVKEYVSEINAYSFNSIKTADFYRRLPEDGKWFFAITFMEKHLDSIIMSPFINTNYDPELPVVKSKFKAASRNYLLNTMGNVRNPKFDKKTEVIKARIKEIIKTDNSRLRQYVMEFFAESATYRKHMHTALGIDDGWWRSAVDQLYSEDEALYYVIMQLLSENKKVGIARKSEAVKKFMVLLRNGVGVVCPYKVALEIPDTTASEMFEFIRENQILFTPQDYDNAVVYFNRNFDKYIYLDESPEALNEMAVDGLVVGDIIKFLKLNLMPISYGCYNYVEGYLLEHGRLPAGRDPQQLGEIKARIAAIKKEIRGVQDDFNKVLSRFN